MNVMQRKEMLIIDHKNIICEATSATASLYSYSQHLYIPHRYSSRKVLPLRFGTYVSHQSIALSPVNKH